MSTDPVDPLERFGEVRRELEARWSETQISPSLDRIRTLTQFLGDPQRAYPVIHVTGTNGKTSTARMIDALLQSFGLHTGMITSPHLSDLRERITLDGQPIGIEEFLSVYDEVAPVLAMADEASELEGGPTVAAEDADYDILYLRTLARSGGQPALVLPPDCLPVGWREVR